MLEHDPATLLWFCNRPRWVIIGTGERIDFLGQPLDTLTLQSTIDRISSALISGRPGAHLGLNAYNFCLARDDCSYTRLLHEAEIVTADGQSVVWAARLLGHSVPERATGIDLMQSLVDLAEVNSWPVYLLGARRDVVSKLARQFTARGVIVAGYRDGYFPPSQTGEVVESVVMSGAKLLFVGMPSPAKDRLIIESARPAGVPFSIGVGGSFDVLAGRRNRAPMVLRRLGLEWAFRMAQEPHRLARRYATTNTRFCLIIARARLAQSFRKM